MESKWNNTEQGLLVPELAKYIFSKRAGFLFLEKLAARLKREGCGVNKG